MITRKAMKAKAAEGWFSSKTVIETAPVAAFFGGILIGVLAVLFAPYLYTLSVVLGIGLAGLWLFAEDEPKPHEREASAVRQAPDQAS